MSSTPPDSPNTPPPSLTRAEFAAAVRVYDRQAAWFAIVALPGLLLSFGVIALLIDVLEIHGIPRDSLWTVPVFTVPLAYMMSVAGLAGWLIQKTRFKCENCRTPLLYRSHVVLVTGRCEKCAHPAFAAEAPVVESQTESCESGLVSQADVEAAEVAARRKAIRPTLKWAVTGAVLLGIGAATYAILQPVIDSSLGELWAPFLQPALLAPGLAIGFWTIAVWARWTCHPVCHCPICGEGISQCAMQTGNCSSCGQRAVSDPFPGMEPASDGPAVSGPAWTITEFSALSSRRHSRLPIGCFIGFPIALAIVLPFPGLVTGVTGLAIQLGGVLWWHRRSSRGLFCPVCNRELLQFYRLVVSSRRCYHCGSVVLRDPPATVD